MEKRFSIVKPDTASYLMTASEMGLQFGLPAKAIYHDFGWRASGDDALSAFLAQFHVDSAPKNMLPYFLGVTVHTKTDFYKGIQRPFGASELFDNRKPVLTDYFSSPTPHPRRSPRKHTGVDLAVAGRPTNAMTLPGVSGFKVIEAGNNGGYGLMIRVSNGVIDMIYAHCSRIFVKKGDSLKPGQLLANCGNTGHSFGNHLHLEVRVNDIPVNPLAFFDLSR